VPETTQSPTPMTRVLAKVGGRRGLVEGGIPPIVFAATNAITGLVGHADQALPVALGTAVASALVIVVLSVVQGASLIGALRGTVLLVVAVGFALWTGSARSFFLPGIYVDALYAVGITLSIVVGRPVVGFAYSLLMGLDNGWRRNPKLRMAFSLASSAWAATYVARMAAQVWLYQAEQTELLAVAKLLLGWPLTALAVLVTLAAVRRARSLTEPRDEFGDSRRTVGRKGPARDSSQGTIATARTAQP
jgi:hypothetical protein